MEILFRSDGDHTIVEFEHRKLEAFDRTGADGHVTGMDDGWGAILEGYRAEVEA